MRQDLEAVRNCQAEHAQRTYNAVELPGKTIGPDFLCGTQADFSLW